MTITKSLCICMDHSSAHLMELTASSIQSKTILSNFTYQEKEDSLQKSESLMHNKEQHKLREYYKQLGNVIRNYEGVLLFGPTEAKSELFNTLKANHNFSKIAIEIRQTDKMTEKQQLAFVKAYYSTF